MFCFSPEAIDITAALARCAMSRTELPDDFAAGFVSAGAAGVLSATCGEPAACFVFGASASFGATMAFDVSASFGAATGFGASASLGASACGAAAATRDGSLCGAEAANLSLNIIEAASLSGFDSARGGGSEANTSVNDGGAGRAATAAVPFTTGASNAALPIEG